MEKSKQDDPASSPLEGDGGFRILGRRFDRLTVRLAVGTALLVIGPLAAGFYLLSQHHFDQTLGTRQRAAELQSRILEAALRHQMMDEDKTLMASIFREIGDQPTVRSAMLLNHEGEVRVASAPEMVGTVFPQDSPSCVVCHAVDPEDRNLWTRVKKDEEEVLRTVLPIENRQECYGCHAPETRLNGILILDTSLADLRAELGSDTLLFVLGTVALALILLAGVRFLVRRLILVRVDRLGTAARSIAGGDLQGRALVGGDDVITSLASDFNHMAETVQHLIADVRAQEAQLANVMNSLDDGLVVLDRELRVLASNRSFCRGLGTYPESLRGRLCHDPDEPVLPCCSAESSCPAQICLETGQSQRAVFHSPSSLDEDGRVQEVYASPIFDAEGQVVQVVEIWRDISERVHEEQHMAEIERLVSLGTLASGFSHEVNTPLATMLTCAESVLARIDERGSEPGDPETIAAIHDAAGIIREQVLRCRKITDQFLRFSRGIPPSVEPLDIGETVTRVVDLVAATAREAGVALRIEGDAPETPVRANAEVVQHVVLNLLVNAIQSCGSNGGTVVLRFASDRPVTLLVEDDGSGVAPEARKHLFEPFRSRKPGGTGLGLFLSRSFLRRFGGDVRLLRSEVGKGSCFEIVFATEGAPA